METPQGIATWLGYLASGGISVYVVLLILIAILIWYRTKSSHVLLSKLWTLFYKKECKVSLVADFLEELTAIHQFRFMTRIQVTSLDQIARIRAMSHSNGKVIAKIAAAGEFYDLDAMRLKTNGLPALWQRVATALILSSLALLILGSTFILAYDRALLRMNVSGIWFSLDESYAKPLSDAAGFRLSACSSPPLPAGDVTGFTQEDTAAICKAFGTADTSQYVRSTVTSQRVGAVIVLYFLISWGWKLNRWLNQANASIKWAEIEEDTVALSEEHEPAS